MGIKKAKPPAQAARRKRIAAKTVAGQSVAAIARAESLSRSHISRLVHSGETQVLIAELLDRQGDAARELVRLALGAIKDALSANNYQPVKIPTLTVKKDKQGNSTTTKTDAVFIIEVGPDHYARLTAAKRAIELLLAGRALPRTTEQADKGLATLEGLRLALAQ